LYGQNAPQRGNKHTARGRAQRHPGYHVQLSNPPWKGKSIHYQILTLLYPIYFYAFALSGREDWQCFNPGVPLRSAPGCVLVAPLGRIHPKRIHPISGR